VTARLRGLILSPILPGEGFWGRYQRFALLGCALGRAADLEVLAFLRGEARRELPALEAQAADAWKTRVRLHACPGAAVSPSLVRRWILSPLDYRRQPALGLAIGAEQVAALRDRLERSRPDFVLAFGLEMMLPLLVIGPRLPVYLDLDDVPHVRAWREAGVLTSPFRRWLVRSQVPGLAWAERRAVLAARTSYVSSRPDRDYLVRRWRLPRVELLPNAVEIPEPLADCPEPSLLLIGQMGYAPNAAAARLLMEEVWPRIRQALPAARLRIAGPGSDALRPEGAPEGVELMGAVSDIGELYAGTRVACAPLRAGSGTRIKILEAAAFGRPVVSTRLGAEGLELADGREILLRDDPRDFADACRELLEDPGRAARLGGAARRRVAERYERSRVIGEIRGLPGPAVAAPPE